MTSECPNCKLKQGQNLSNTLSFPDLRQSCLLPGHCDVCKVEELGACLDGCLACRVGFRWLKVACGVAAESVITACKSSKASSMDVFAWRKHGNSVAHLSKRGHVSAFS